MHISFVFRHMESSDALKEHITEKLEKIKKYLINGVEAHVVMSVEKFRHQCEIHISERDFSAQALEESEDLYASIDMAVHKLERQLKKHKERVKDHKIKEARELRDSKVFLGMGD